MLLQGGWQISIRIISATRLAGAVFLGLSPLGLSLERLKLDKRIASTIVAENRSPLPAIYNEAIEAAADADILVFMHDDVWIEDIFFADRLIEAVEAFDVVGVAGTRVLHPGQTAWFEDPLTKEPDRGNLSGAVGHGRTAFSTIFRYGPPRLACELLDGMFLAAKRATLLTANLRFDPAFDFHFYDLDFCRSARAKGLTLGTWPIVLGHASHGAYDSPAWAEKRDDYLRKWGE